MAILNNQFNENIDGILDGFEQSAMLESDTKQLDAIGGKNSPLGNLRFLLDPKLGKKIYNLDGINKFEEVLETYSQYFRTSLGTNLRIEDDSAKFRASQGPRKGISVWDFDDTLATTKYMIGVEMPDGKKTKIDAETFAKTSDKLASEGAKFDFEEFNKVMKGRKGPMFEKALNRNRKFGNENVLFLISMYWPFVMRRVVAKNLRPSIRILEAFLISKLMEATHLLHCWQRLPNGRGIQKSTHRRIDFGAKPLRD